jgi:ribosomal protein S28E/S33
VEYRELTFAEGFSVFAFSARCVGTAGKVSQARVTLNIHQLVLTRAVVKGLVIVSELLYLVNTVRLANVSEVRAIHSFIEAYLP